MSIKRVRIAVIFVLMFVLLIGLAACGGQSSEKSSSSPQEKGSNNVANNEQVGPDPDAELAKLDKEVLTTGPNGEKPTSFTTVKLTEEDLKKVKEMHLTAAISMQYMGNDWSATQVRALKDEFEKMGVKVVGVTDANFKPEKQTSDIETLMAKKPDILVSIPVDTVANAGAYKKAAQKGTKIVFMNQAAQGLKAGEDYVTVISPADYENGARAAHLIARELGGKGKVGIIYYDANFPTTEIRYKAAKDVFAKYPGISIAQEQGIAGPDFVGAAEKAANALLLREPDLDAIWGIWDVPAEGIVSAVRNAGRADDVIVTTIDLGKSVAMELAKGGVIKGIGAQTVYEAGVTEARAAVLGVLGKPVEPFIVMNGITVDKTNVLEAWKQVYATEPIKELKNEVK
jgi:ribose transport system substrate-binding protein